MTFVEKMLVRQAVELSAVIGDHSETILNLTVSFIQSEFKIDIPLEAIRKELDKASAARLFFACGKSKPEEIRNPQNCMRLARNLWLDNLIVTTSQPTCEQLIKQAEKLHLEEKKIAPALESTQSPLVQAIKSLSEQEDGMAKYRKYISVTAQYYQVAFFVLDEFFQNSTVYNQFKLYNPFSKESISQPEDKGCVAEMIQDTQIEDKQVAKIKYLEKTIHELKVKLDYAQKDAVREIIMTLASSGFGSPLFELHQIKKSEETPENVVATISNLLLALESLDIRFTKESWVGKVLTQEEIADGQFCLKNDEMLSPEDKVVVTYPGIKLGKETIVKPTITKEN